MTKVIIYILCSDCQKLNSSAEIYNKYSWAKPILLLKQDYSFENTFWKQLEDIQFEWENYDMVGTLSYSSFKKINLDKVDQIIKHNLYYPNKYYHFMDSNVPIPNHNTDKHPKFRIIWNDILYILNLKSTTENCCNYWMCSPLLMKHFINWYNNTCLPVLIKHPLIFSNANYTGADYNNTILSDKLIKIWGKPYYPHFPFIAERLNKCFFETYYSNQVEKVNNFCYEDYINNNNDLKSFSTAQAKQHFYKYGQFERRACNNIENELLPRIVFFISHDKNKGGAQNCLFNVENIYRTNGIKTEMLYLEDVNFNIVEYILNKSVELNSFPVVFCNTLVSYNIVNILSKTNILTYWYIHEWYDDFTKQFFEKYISDVSIFNSSINLIFVCNASFINYSNYIKVIKNQHVIYNTYCPEKLLYYMNQEQSNITKQDEYIYISIIGTIEARKNQQSFIDNVFYKLKDKYTNIKLVIVGRISESLNILPAYINDIIVIGVVDNAIPYINLSDIIVSYSINEVFPLNIIESFYCSKPVVSSNVGGINEIIKDNYDGYLFKTNDHNKCFEILCNLIEDKMLRYTIGTRAKETFLNKFDEKNVVDKFLSLLEYAGNLELAKDSK